MKTNIEKLVTLFSYCSVQGNCLYWRSGKTSGRILLINIDSITFEQKGKAKLASSIGTEFGYHEVLFDSTGASFTEVLDDVTYF